VWFLTRSSSGLLLYNGQRSDGDGDFVSLHLSGNRLHYVYDLGGGPARAVASATVENDRWHVARISREGPIGHLRLDGGVAVKAESPKGMTELNVEMPLYLGGAKFPYSLSKFVGEVGGLNGAIQRVVVIILSHNCTASPSFRSTT